MVRYADDFVVLARYISPRLQRWIENQLEGTLGLTVNRDKTRIVSLNARGMNLSFLGFTLRFDRALQGRAGRYSNIVPSARALGRIRDRVRELTRRGWSRSLDEVIADVNRTLASWAGYFRYGYPRQAFRALNHFVRGRFRCWLRNRSQRRCRPFRAGESLYAGLQRYGLRYL